MAGVGHVNHTVLDQLRSNGIVHMPVVPYISPSSVELEGCFRC